MPLLVRIRVRGTQPGLRRSRRFETDYVCRRQVRFFGRVTHRGRNEAETRAEGRARAAQKFGKHGREATSPDVFGHRPGFAELPRRGVRARVLRPWLFFPRTRPTTAASAAQTIKPELARLADVETIKPFHEFSTNDQTVWDLRSGKGAAAVVFFPAHTADHDGHSSADNQARTCKVVGQGTMIPFHEFSELHQAVSHAQYKGLPANVLTAEKWICARDTCSADRRFLNFRDGFRTTPDCVWWLAAPQQQVHGFHKHTVSTTQLVAADPRPKSTTPAQRTGGF